MYTNKLVSSFKERLSILCERSELKDTEIARSLDVSKQTLSAWRCGTRSPRRPTIETIARKFGVKVDWLLGFDVPEKEEAKQEKPIQLDELRTEVFNLLVALPEKDLSRVRDFLAGLQAARAEEEVHRK